MPNWVNDGSNETGSVMSVSLSSLTILYMWRKKNLIFTSWYQSFSHLFFGRKILIRILVHVTGQSLLLGGRYSILSSFVEKREIMIIPPITLGRSTHTTTPTGVRSCRLHLLSQKHLALNEHVKAPLWCHLWECRNRNVRTQEKQKYVLYVKGQGVVYTKHFQMGTSCQ